MASLIRATLSYTGFTENIGGFAAVFFRFHWSPFPTGIFVLAVAVRRSLVGAIIDRSCCAINRQKLGRRHKLIHEQLQCNRLIALYKAALTIALNFTSDADRAS